jgi:hypothetical protein
LHLLHGGRSCVCKECRGACLFEHGKQIRLWKNGRDVLLPLDAGAAILAAAVPALGASLTVLADAGAAAVLALVALPVVLADAGAAALLANWLLAAVRADARAATVPAPRPPLAVLADTCAATLLAA